MMRHAFRQVLRNGQVCRLRLALYRLALLLVEILGQLQGAQASIGLVDLDTVF